MCKLIPTQKPENEAERLNALWSCELLDTEPEGAFDAMTILAANLCRTPIAIISLVDQNRQWFKSKCGLDGVTSTDRDVAFCAHAIRQTGIMEVPDACADERFADNPLVTGYPGIRFYAAAPLVDAGGFALGTLCVIDRRPRLLDDGQKAALMKLAQAVAGLVALRIRRSEFDEHRRSEQDNQKAHDHLERRSELLRTFARRAKDGEFLCRAPVAVVRRRKRCDEERRVLV